MGGVRSEGGLGLKALQGLIDKLGVKIPDTVLLKNGKPRKKFWLDGSGRLQVEHLKSSAQLLRVLRQFVAKAQRPPRIASKEPTHRGSSQMNASVGKVLQQSKSDSMLKRNHSGQGGGSAARPDFVAENKRLQKGSRDAPPMTEVAVLYYDDGAVRYMTSAEATKQMENASRLPKEFWQHIVMLQVPVSVTIGMPNSSTKYITYNFDIDTKDYEPQAPLPLRHRRKNSVPNLNNMQDGEGRLVAAVPRRINECLAERKGKFGAGLSIMRGRFEFVNDQVDGSLWLINAGGLRCTKSAFTADEDEDSEPSEEIRYFKEEEFSQLMHEQEDQFDDLKGRWKLEKPVVPMGLASGIRVASGEENVQLTSLSAADRLQGVKPPHELVKYYEAETEMLNYYMTEIKSGGVEQEKKRKALGDRAVGKSIWFKRWVRSHGKRRFHSALSAVSIVGANTEGGMDTGAVDKNEAFRPGSAVKNESFRPGPFSRERRGSSAGHQRRDSLEDSLFPTQLPRPKSAATLSPEELMAKTSDDDLFGRRSP